MNRAVEIMNDQSFLNEDQGLIENLIQCNGPEQSVQQERQIHSMQRLNQFIDESHRNIVNASYQYPDYPQQYQINQRNVLSQQENLMNLSNHQPNQLNILSPMVVQSPNRFYIEPDYQLTNYSPVCRSQPFNQSYYIDQNVIMYPQPSHDHAYFRVVTSQNDNQSKRQSINQRRPLSQISSSQSNSQMNGQFNSQSSETVTDLDDPKEPANKRQKTKDQTPNSSQATNSQSSSDYQISLPDHLKQYFQNENQTTPLFSKNFIMMQTSKLRYNLQQFIFQNNFNSLGIEELNDLNDNQELINLFSHQLRRIQEKNSIMKSIKFKNRKLVNIGLSELSSQAYRLNLNIRIKKHKENVIKLEDKINKLNQSI